MRRYAIVALLLLTAACSDAAVGPSVRRAPEHVALVSSPHFRLLPPIGANNGGTIGFDPTAVSVVEVCRTTAGECGVRLRTYTLGGSNPDAGIVIDTRSEFFQVNVTFSGLGVAVQGGDKFAVRVLSSQSSTAKVYGGFIVAFDQKLKGTLTLDGAKKSGSISATESLPVKYRIEAGAVCEMLPNATENCLEVRVTNAGGTFINNDTTAGARFPANALPAGTDQVTLVVDTYVPPPGPTGPLPENAFCLPDTNPQYNGCRIFTTFPHVDAFNGIIEIAICPDYEAYSTLGSQIEQVDLWKWDGVNENTYKPLSAVETSFMECEEPLATVGSASTRSSAFALARTALQPLKRLVMPAPLYAAMRGKISPYGGGVSDFSNIGPVRRLRMETFSGDGVNALPGTTVTSSVRVLADGQDVAALNQGVAGVPVHFVITSGSGSIVSVADVVTNADGVATVQWTLGAGVNTLRAEGLNPRAESPFNIPGIWGSQTIGAVGVKVASGFAYGTSFTSPVTKTAPGATVPDDITYMLTMEACAEDVTPRQCFTVPFAGGTVPSYDFVFTSTTAMPAGAYTFTTKMLDLPFGMVTARASTADRIQPLGATDYAFTLGQSITFRFTVTKRPL